MERLEADEVTPVDPAALQKNLQSCSAESATPKDPLALLALAVEKGFDADQLGKLVELQERWRRARAEEAYNQAMTACQQAMPVVLFDKQNPHTKSQYASRDAVNKTVRPVYTQHGFSLSFTTEDCPLENHYRIVCRCGHKDGHSTLHKLDLPLDGQGAKGGNSAMNAVQGGGSTISYGARYLTLMIFNIAPAEEDNDGAGKYITGDQIKEINELIEECRAVGKPVNLDRLLTWLEVESLDKLTHAGYSKAVHELNRKRRS